jgi:glycosyltransferase involved in cell wall biosynthesis
LKSTYPKGISIIICCYNSADRITPTLKHIAAQQTPSDLPWEVVLVNNNSSDDTVSVAERVWGETGSSVALQIVDEPVPGLMPAKQKGIATAQYEYVLICDDDNWLQEDYIRIAFETMESHPNIGVLGGRSKAASDVSIPFWFPTFQGSYAVGVQSLETGYVTRRRYVWGAGAVMRKSVLDQLKTAGFKSILKGREGKKLSSGEDSEACRWFILAGYELFYHEDLQFQHFIPAERLTKGYVKRLHQGFGQAKGKIAVYDAVLDVRARPIVHFLEAPFLLFSYLLIRLVRMKRTISSDQLGAQLEALNPFPFAIFSADTHRLKKNLRTYRKHTQGANS